MASVAVVLALVWLIAQWRAIHTENVNWDEFALVARATETVRSGRLAGAGRLGLATLILVPFVEHCSSAVQTVVAARRLWLAITLAYLAGVFAIVWYALPGVRRRWLAASLAVVLLALVPVFLRWSLQVRSDQPALMFAAWGAALLIAASCRLWLAAPAGVLFGLGYLCSQKAAYVAVAPAAILAVRLAPGLDIRAFDWRKAARLAFVAAAALAATLLAFTLVISSHYVPARSTTLAAGFDTFAYYRRLFGVRAYRAMLPTLWPHILLVGLLFGALLASGRRKLRSRPELIAGWLLLFCGLAVGAFHAAAFPYFWMTLGLFPAVAAGVGVFALFEVYGRGIASAVLLLCGVLLVGAAAAAEHRLGEDTQRVQRDAEAFIARNFDAEARGFHAEGGLFCRPDPAPFPTYFAESVSRLFTSDGAAPRVDAFIDEFRRRPVAFMVAPRVTAFGPAIERFWAQHYVLYRDEVMVPGIEIAGGESMPFEAIVPGAYRWHAHAGLVLSVDGAGVMPGGTIPLSAGVHTLALGASSGRGIFAVALQDPPRADGPPYYAPAAIRELDPLYPRFVRSARR